jgi:hypothetical protein
MKHLLMFISDTLYNLLDGLDRLVNLFRKKKEPSLLVLNVAWCTNAKWFDYIQAYRQLDLWTFNK